MKKLLLAVLALILCISMCSCCCTSIFTKEKPAPDVDVNLSKGEESKTSGSITYVPNESKPETSKEPETVDPFEEVDTLIDQGKYAEAYEKLLAMTDNEAAKERLEDFVWVYSEKIDNEPDNELRVTYSYNEKGLVIEEKHYYSEDPDILHCYYDEKGQLIKEEYIAYNGGDGHTREYTYDAKGNCIKEVLEYVGAHIEVEYTYNAQNLLVSETMTEQYEFETFVTTTEYKYDNKGRLIETGSYDNGYYEKFKTYSYDERDNLLIEADDYYVYQYEYDSNNRCVYQSEFETWSNETTEYYYVYDENGNLKESRYESDDFSSGYYKYTYDKLGNCIKDEIYKSYIGVSYTIEYNDYRCYYIGE